MEPITTAWMMTTLLSGWIGSRGDYWLCKGANTLYSRIKSNLNEPANHSIRRAVRKSYLKASTMAVDHIQGQRSRFSLTNRSWQNLEELKIYLKGQINLTTKEDGLIRNSKIDTVHREILFPKEGDVTSRMPELIQNFKDGIIHELEGGRRRVESELKECIYHGWQEKNREIDFYKLTCAFFTQELKDNTQLSTYIQTEYLDHISNEIAHVSIQMSELSATLNPIFEEYQDVLPKLKEILTGIEALHKGQQKIINELPERTAKLVVEKINEGIITPRQISVSDDYQNYIKEIESIVSHIKALQTQIDGITNAIAQVDEDTKIILEQNKQHLETQLLQQSTKKNSKENELNTFVSNVIQLAEQLKQSDTLNSERLQKARALFREGKYHELNEVLNEAEIDYDIAQYEKKRKIWAKEYTIKAQTAVISKAQGWFEEADRLYSKALHVIENHDTTFDYAYFLAKHNQILRAADLYKSSLKYISEDAQKATTLNNLAVLQRAKNEFGKAEASYGEALAIRRKLALNDPKTYLPHVATTLNNLAVLQSEKNEFGKAEASYGEALAIRRKLAETNPQAYLPDVAGTLNNLAVLQSEKNEFGKAETFYEEALSIGRKLAETNPQAYLPHVAGTLNNLANLQRAKNEFVKAEASYGEALAIYRELANVNPQTYLLDVAKTLNNLAVLYNDKNEFGKAEASYGDALAIYRELADDNPQTYLPYVATTLNNWANLQRDINEFGKSEASYGEALAIRRKLADDNPQTYLPYVATTLNNLAVLYNDKNEFGKGEASYGEALAIYRKLADANPQTYLPDVATTLNNWANLQRDINEFGKSEASYGEALAIRRKLADDNPQTYLPYVATTLNNLAVLYNDKNEFGKGEASYGEALAIYRELADANPQTYLPDVATTLNNWANLQRDINEFGKVETFYDEALAIRRKLAHNHPKSFSIQYADTAVSLAIFYRYFLVNKEKSIYYAKEALTWYEPFRDTIPHAEQWSQKAEEILEELNAMN